MSNPPRRPFPVRPHALEDDMDVLKRMTPEQRVYEHKWRKEVEIRNRTPSRMNKMLGWASWGSVIFVVGWMALYEDFGPQENVFTDLRKSYREFMKSTFNLSPSERSILGMDKLRAKPVEGRMVIDRLNEEVAALHPSQAHASGPTPKTVINDGKPS